MLVFSAFYQLLRGLLVSRLVLVTENLALRQQLLVLTVRRIDLCFVTEIACSGSPCRICGATGAPSSSSLSQRRLSNGTGRVSSATGAGSLKGVAWDAPGLVRNSAS